MTCFTNTASCERIIFAIFYALNQRQARRPFSRESTQNSSMKAPLSSPLVNHALRVDCKIAGGLSFPVGPDGLEPPSIRAGHAGPVTSFHIRLTANWTGLEEGAPS
jgi:hypothetical protein